jgi:hypothetical protein
MMLAPRPRSTAADLVRVLACWLAVIVLLQGLGAAQALGRGPLHRHAESLAAASQHHHDGAERHHHDAQDLSVLEIASAQDNTVDVGAFALVAALALMALTIARAWRDGRRHVWRPAPSWAWHTHVCSALRKPPRQG